MPIPKSNSASPRIKLKSAGLNIPSAHRGIASPIIESRPSWHPGANLDSFTFVFEIVSFWWDLFRYHRYFCNRAWLRNLPSVESCAYNARTFVGPIPPSQAFPPKIPDMFTCLVARVTWFSDISPHIGSLSFVSKKDTYVIYLFPFLPVRFSIPFCPRPIFLDSGVVMVHLFFFAYDIGP